ncbi:SGNH/GDSL hydrolase family protein [Myxosarcina sp. GI1]|uniref:SGNH/GDSL hydrolase family protein n=1 Tax=Myxosarcina sp. GI1 TaxID=1541065 RepID=UPI00055D33F4|nr:SGNH/GDSL hydrolase family protein [Myxosarcina sp. GI1]
MFLPKRRFPEKSILNIAIAGGSNSLIRNGYTKYLNDSIGQITGRQTRLNYYAVGGVTNVHALVQNYRYSIEVNSDLIFYEYCINTRHAIEIKKYSLELAGKALEGFIRRVKNLNPQCIIIILIFGVNLDDYYENDCDVSNLYELIGKHYDIPIVNLTSLLIKERGIDFTKSLYNNKDHAHYTRPYGVKVVADRIVKYLKNLGITEVLTSKDYRQKTELENLSNIPKLYQDNFEQLAFLDCFQDNCFTGNKPKVSVYQNSVFKEQNYTIDRETSLNFFLKGRLAGIYIKSDLNDGFFRINFNSQQLVTSSFSSWNNYIKSQNISFISLPLLKFSPSTDFNKLSISICPDYPEKFELDIFKTVPMRNNPNKWKLNIIGVAYIGEISYLSNS